MVLESEWMPVEKQLVRLPNGNLVDWFIGVGPSAVIVIPILENGEIMLQRTYKHGAGEEIIEFCAGIIEKGEDPKKAAKRELLEETGCKAEEIEFLGEFFANPTGSQTKYFLYCATGCRVVAKPTLDEAEQIENFSVSGYETLENEILSSENKTSMAVLAALPYARKCMKDLKKSE